jgi:hypothetical protein
MNGMKLKLSLKFLQIPLLQPSLDEGDHFNSCAQLTTRQIKVIRAPIQLKIKGNNIRISLGGSIIAYPLPSNQPLIKLIKT